MTPRRRAVPTIVTVAREAGVHTSTASRALSSDPKVRAGVAETTRTRVEEAAARLGYRRNRMGAGLRTGRAGVIGVLVPRITDSVVALLYEALDAAARQAGYVTLIGNTLEDPDIRHERILQLLDHGVDAVVFCDARLDESAGPGYRVPVLPVMRSSATACGTPRAADFDGGRQAAAHLRELGHHRIGVVAGPATASTARDRAAGFIAELSDAGIDLGADDIVHCAFDVSSGKGAAAALLDRPQPPTAIFAVNDLTAIGVMAAARGCGLSVPGELSVVGFNDIPLAAELPIPLTTVRSPLTQAGRLAAEVAIAAIAGEERELEPLPTELVVRETTTAVAT